MSPEPLNLPKQPPATPARGPVISFHPLLRIVFKRELIDFFKNLALMAQSGIPVNEALGVISSQTRNSTFRSFVAMVKKQVEHGSALSGALMPYRAQIGDLAINIIRAGELNGTLEQNLQYLADIMTRNRDLRSKIQAALLYPEIVLTMTFFIGGGISIFILPKLIPLFTSLNVELPLATKILLAVSLFLRDHGGVAFLATVGAVTLFLMIRRLPGFRWFFDTIAVHLPFFGRLLRNYQLALFGQIFGTLFKSGLTIKEALSATADALTNERYRQVLRAAIAKLNAGTPLAELLGRVPSLFPENVTAIVSVGEKSGKLDESFHYLASYFDNEVDVQVKRLPTLLEPVLLIIIGLVVAFVALAVITPIYELTSGLQQRTR